MNTGLQAHAAFNVILMELKNICFFSHYSGFIHLILHLFPQFIKMQLITHTQKKMTEYNMQKLLDPQVCWHSSWGIFFFF